MLLPLLPLLRVLHGALKGPLRARHVHPQCLPARCPPTLSTWGRRGSSPHSPQAPLVSPPLQPQCSPPFATLGCLLFREGKKSQAFLSADHITFWNTCPYAFVWLIPSLYLGFYSNAISAERSSQRPYLNHSSLTFCDTCPCSISLPSTATIRYQITYFLFICLFSVSSKSISPTRSGPHISPSWLSPRSQKSKQMDGGWMNKHTSQTRKFKDALLVLHLCLRGVLFCFPGLLLILLYVA